MACRLVADQLQQVRHVQATESAYAVQDDLHDIQRIWSTKEAFAVLRGWKDPDLGLVEVIALQDQLHDVREIYSCHCGFAAVVSESRSVVTWGVADCSEGRDQLHGVRDISGT
jgi:hypothetical protein